MLALAEYDRKKASTREIEAVSVTAVVKVLRKVRFLEMASVRVAAEV